MLVKAEAEIEQLKQSKNILSDLLYKMEAKANRHEALIAKLSDALDRCDPIQISIGEVADLIDQARAIQ